MWYIRKIKRAAVFALLLCVVGCSTRPFLDFLDWAKPARVTLGADVKPYGGVCIPQGELPGQVSPIPGPTTDAVPPPAPFPESPNSPVPPPSPEIPPPPALPN